MSKKSNWGFLALLGGILIDRNITQQGEETRDMLENQHEELMQALEENRRNLLPYDELTDIEKLEREFDL